MIITDSKRLSPHLVWVFAAVALVAGIIISFATASHSWKLTAGLMFGTVGLAACAGAYLTRATTVQAILPFAAAAVVLAGIYFWAVHRVTAAAASTASAVGGGDAVSKVGNAFAVVIAGLILIDGLAAGIGGALCGIRLRSVKSPSDLLRRPV